MPIEITAEFLRKVTSSKHSNFKETVELAQKLKVHANGEVPGHLIDERRPSEPEDIKAYRRKIYVPKTKNPISKVVNSLEKIRRSQDWVIQYDQNAVKKSITEDETLEVYCEENYPAFTSLTNWVFSELLKQYLLDANGFVAVVPKTQPESASEYVKPVAVFFDSTRVLDCMEGEYIVLLSADTSTYNTPNGRYTRTDGVIYYVITTTQVVRYEQTSTQGDLEATLVYEHGFGVLPAFKVGGIFLKRKNNATIYESRISSMAPSLDEAAREYSDLQAEIVQHIHSEKYAYTNTECPDCRGVGSITKEDGGERIQCQRCKGVGSILNTSPYGIHLIQAAAVAENQIPTPPIAYVQKSVDIAKLQDERVRQHIYDALSTLNMEFLAEVPLSQSGIAKVVDKDELNNFVNGVAEDLVGMMDKVYHFINEYRYAIIVPNEADRKAMLPKVNVPMKYDILSGGYLINEMAAAKAAGVSPVIMRELQIEYAKKQFYTTPEISYEAQAVFELDPLYGLTEDEKMTRKANGGVTEVDYIISCNIGSFVRRAVEADKNFYSLTFDKKTEKMRAFADEIQKTNVKTVLPDDQDGLNE